MLHQFTRRQFSVFSSTADLSFQSRWNDRHQIYPPTWNNQKKKKQAKYIWNNLQDTDHQATKDSVHWERKIKGNKPYDCPWLLLWEYLQAVMQGSGAQQTPWIEDTDLRVSGNSQGLVTERRQLHSKRTGISISAVHPLQVQLAFSVETCGYRRPTVLYDFILETSASADLVSGELVLEPIPCRFEDNCIQQSTD